MIEPPVSFESDNSGVSVPSFGDYTLPTIIIWHPILTFSPMLSLSMDDLKCNQCGKKMHVGHWNDGMSQHTQPRLLHDIDECVLLVSAVYVCMEQHKILAHDERILTLLRGKIQVPFVLLHQTGFTTRFVEICESLCQTGMNFHSLEGVIGNMRWKKYEEKTQMYQQTLESYKKSHKGEDIENAAQVPTFEMSTHYKHLPSDDIISKCFVAKFMDKELDYKREVQSIDTGEELSFDHTFKVATNIGFLRADNKWVCQYDSVFIVFNANGKILTWQFTKGTGFDNVKSILQHIHRRSQSQAHTINTVYIDNCCHWRAKIRAVFGEQVKVLLDLFHAVQRISKTLPKRHPFHAACLHDLRFVFRQPGDYGEKRTMATPAPDKIVQNLEKFYEKWSDVSYEDQHIFSESTKSEIEKLKVHASKGCLSNINVGAGTNKNEAFHRYVNTFFHKSRIGILLSYALMMTIIHQYNSKPHNNRKSIFVPVKKCFGNEVDTNTYEPMGIINSETGSDHTWYQENSDGDIIDTTSVVDILQVSLAQLTIYKGMKSQTNTASSLLKYMPFAQILPYIECARSDQNIMEHKTRLNSTLASWNFTLLPVMPDGNCFFTSVAIALVNGGIRSKEAIAAMGLSMSSPLTVLASRLREILVQEWLGSNKCEYECFISAGSSFEMEASEFLKNGYYNSDLGNTMPLGMANALKVSFVVFTSLSSSPVFFVAPREPSTEVLYLAFTYCGAGHYDGAIFKGENVTKMKVKCRCGVNTNPNDKENKISCSHQLGRHSACKCLANGSACSSSCGCKGCSNPNGVRRPTNLGKRKREQHMWQKNSCP